MDTFEQINYKSILDKLTNSVADDLAYSGNKFFEAIVNRIADIFSADYVFVGLLLPEKKAVQTIMLHAKGSIAPNFEYELKYTPCEEVVGKKACCYPGNICQLFPKDILLQDMSIEGYIGVPLYKSDGSPLGIIVALFENPIRDITLVETIIQLYAFRTASELERMEISQQLQESNTHFMDIFEHAPVGLLELDLSHTKKKAINKIITKEEYLSQIPLLSINHRAMEALHQNMVPSNILEINKSCPEFITLFTESIVQEAFPNKKYTGETTLSIIRDNQKEEYSVHWTIPEQYLDTWERVILSIEDVTQTKQLERQLHHSQKMDAIGQLAGGIAHDFNNMIGGIMGAADIIKTSDDQLNQTNAKMLDLIISTAERSSELNSKLLTFSRQEEKEKTSVSINNIIDSAVTILKRAIDKKVEIIVQSDEDYTVLGDPSSLQNALMNIGINAAHAMPDGGRFTIKTERMELNKEYCRACRFTVMPGHYVQISLRDTGLGIPEKYREHIFEPFFTTKVSGKGTGLGLAAVYGTIVNHDGAIEVYSEEGSGTVFHLYIPMIESKIERGEKKHQIHEGKGTVLLVDDEEIIRESGKYMLEFMGYSVIVANNGQEALEIYRQQYNIIDLIITDMIMPIMNGKELFAKAKEINPNCKVILSSGFTKNESVNELSTEGLSNFISKPFRMTDLSKVVTEVVKNESSIQ